MWPSEPAAALNAGFAACRWHVGGPRAMARWHGSAWLLVLADGILPFAKWSGEFRRIFAALDQLAFWGVDPGPDLAGRPQPLCKRKYQAHAGVDVQLIIFSMFSVWPEFSPIGLCIKVTAVLPSGETATFSRPRLPRRLLKISGSTSMYCERGTERRQHA